MAVFCGIDWAEEHHDVAVVDTDGRLVAKRRIGEDAAGFGQLLEVLAEAGDSPETPIPVAIETTRGLLVACLRATGRPVYAINPLAVARYRERHAVSGKKSDHADALVLANILRTDRATHRPLPGDPPAAAGRPTGRCRPTPSWSAQSPCWPESSQRLGRHRWPVERALSWLSCYRRLQVRWDRGSQRWFAFVLLACALVCFNHGRT